MMRAALVAAAREQGVDVHDGGTMVVIGGPRFSTRAESRWFARSGFDVVNMTGYPEGWLSRELGICYANVSLVTDYDVGVDGVHDRAVTQGEVMEVFARNISRVRDLLFAVIPRLGEPAAGDPCPRAVEDAHFWLLAPVRADRRVDRAGAGADG